VIPERCAGILIPLFSLRSPGDRGRGDIGGIVPFGEFARAMGHRLLQFLPIDETAPGETSPYSAMSVMAIDPLFVSIRELSGSDGTAPEGIDPPVDLNRLRSVKEARLEAAYRHYKTGSNAREQTGFGEFVAANRGWLDDYALFRALKQTFDGGDWRDWPAGLGRHDQAAIAEASRALADRLEELKYFQFVAHRQWIEARDHLRQRGVFFGGDLAFSPARESAEAWANQAMFDCGRSVGAPPDAFSATGQRWGLPMPDWARIRASGFGLLRARIRRARELYDTLRIDHVVGLFRTYGYPLDEGTPGAFDPLAEEAQRAQGEEILRIILEEAGPMRLIAEDLGVIPPFVRETMAALTIPGYKIARWEREWTAPSQPFIDPATYPIVSMATTGTHDTDALGEWWETISTTERCAFLDGLRIADSANASRSRLDQPTVDLILEALYASPSELVIVPIQDLFGWKDRINLPGTVNPSNWRWRLPFDPANALDDSKLRARVECIRAIAEKTGRLTPK
jgi:4-alpha-glucanotransferase